MSDTITALPLLQPPSVTGTWLRNNVIFALAATVIGVGVFALERSFGFNDPHPTSTIRIAAAATNAAAVLAIFLAYAGLTGVALAQALPRFARRGWMMLHGAIGAVFALIIGAGAYVASGFETVTTSGSADTGGIIILTIAAALIGAMAGAAGAAVQAIVIKRAAKRTGLWIGTSAIAVALSGVLIAGAIATGLLDVQQTIGGFARWQALSFAATLLTAVIMLPAIKRLEPRD